MEQKLIKIQRVPETALIDLKVSGSFLKRCQVLLLALSSQMKPEDLTAMFEKFAKTQEEPTDNMEAMIFLLTSLVGEIEKKALEQNQVLTEELSPEKVAELFKEK